MTVGPSPGQTDVVVFVRTLDSKIAGGTRAVLARANMFAELGYRVTVVVTNLLGDGGAWARENGLLSPDVRVLVLWRDGPRAADREAAAAREPLVVPRIPDGPGVTRRRRTVDGRIRVRTFVDGVARTFEVLDADTQRTRELVEMGDGGARTRWVFAAGTLIAIESRTPDSTEVRRQFVVDGRSVWLDAEVSGTIGTGAAHLRLRDEHVGDYATAIARWMDDEFASAERLVVFADGENVWQRSLRQMRHPRVQGVSVLHNSHLTEPYDAAAPTKPHWKGFFSDTTNVGIMVCLTDRQRGDLLQRYPDLPLRVLRHAAPRTRLRGVRRDPNAVVFVGRLSAQKQLDHLVRAFALVAQRVPRAHLDIHGHGPDLAALQALVAELGVDVRFPGATSQPLHAFAGARVAAMSSHYEGLPLTLTEGMSVGTPFVAYDCNYGPAEVIRDGENGFLVPKDDVAGLADRLVQVLESGRLARRLSRRARRVTKEFSERRYRDAWVQVITDLG